MRTGYKNNLFSLPPAKKGRFCPCATFTGVNDRQRIKVDAGREKVDFCATLRLVLSRYHPLIHSTLLMLLYNVTVTLDLDIHEDWLRWMRTTHVPDVMSTGMFLSYRLCKLLGHEHDDSEIYAVQYLVRDMPQLRRYLDDFAPDLQRQHKERYDGKYAVFRTVMEVVDHNEG